MFKGFKGFEIRVGKVGPSGGEKAVAKMQLEGAERVKIAALIDRVESMVGRINDDEYKEQLEQFKNEFAALSKEEKSAVRLAIGSVATGWDDTKSKLNPALDVLSAGPHARAQELKAWMESQ